MSHPLGNANGHVPYHNGESLTPHDLPPVEPPSGQFIVRLFLIPLAIVVGLVGGWWLLVGLPFGRMAGGERDPIEYVNIIRTRTDARRNRAAFELASLIQNDPALARDSHLLGALNELLNTEAARRDSKGEPTGDMQIVRFLAAALGIFETSEAITPSGKKLDPIATLVELLDPKYPDVVRHAAAESLARRAGRYHDELKNPEAVRALELASHADGPEIQVSRALREMSIFALGFFADDEAQKILRDRLHSEDPYLRYNAAIPLIRRGDLAALPVARQMLTPKDLERVVKLDAAAETQAKIEAIELGALQALELSVRQAHSPELAEKLRPEITYFSQSGLSGIRTQAIAVLKSFPSAGNKPKKP